MEIDIDEDDTNKAEVVNDGFRLPPQKSARYVNKGKTRSKSSTSTSLKELNRHAPPKSANATQPKKSALKKHIIMLTLGRL